MRSSVYHPGFNFSWSLKSVIPAIFGEQDSYSKNKINDGLQSQKTYLDAIRNNTLEKNRQDLIDYCNKDVLEMARLYFYLHENAKENSS
jgi:7-keto-8-aminopelargonate synthetase-like enzyme